MGGRRRGAARGTGGTGERVAAGQLISVSKTQPYARRWLHIVYLYRNNPHQSWGFLTHLHNSSIILAKASCKSGSFQVLISCIDAPLPPAPRRCPTPRRGTSDLRPHKTHVQDQPRPNATKKGRLPVGDGPFTNRASRKTKLPWLDGPSAKSAPRTDYAMAGAGETGLRMP